MDLYITTFYIVLSSVTFVPGQSFEYESQLDLTPTAVFPSVEACRERAQKYVDTQKKMMPWGRKLVYMCKPVNTKFS
jgi:hypothetical protein